MAPPRVALRSVADDLREIGVSGHAWGPLTWDTGSTLKGAVANSSIWRRSAHPTAFIRRSRAVAKSRCVPSRCDPLECPTTGHDVTMVGESHLIPGNDLDKSAKANKISLLLL